KGSAAPSTSRPPQGTAHASPPPSRSPQPKISWQGISDGDHHRTWTRPDPQTTPRPISSTPPGDGPTRARTPTFRPSGSRRRTAPAATRRQEQAGGLGGDAAPSRPGFPP